jgi:hypothetical protein
LGCTKNSVEKANASVNRNSAFLNRNDHHSSWIPTVVIVRLFLKPKKTRTGNHDAGGIDRAGFQRKAQKQFLFCWVHLSAAESSDPAYPSPSRAMISAWNRS